MKWPHYIFVFLFLMPRGVGAAESPEAYELLIEVEASESSVEDEPTVSGEDRPLTTIRSAAPSAAELFRDVGGVEVRRSGASGQNSSLSIRGSDGQQTQVQIDGVPVGALLGGGTDLSLVPVWGIEKIRILRGGLSDRAGSDALGGLVDFQTRAPLRDEIRAAARIGSFGYAGVDGLVGLGGENLSGRVVFSSMLSQGDFPYRDQHGQAAIRQNADMKRNQAMLSLMARNPEHQRLRLTHLTTVFDRGIPGPAQFPTPNARQEAIHLFTSLHGTSPLGSDLVFESRLAHRMERSHYWDLDANLDSSGEQRALMHQFLLRSGLSWFPNSEHEFEAEVEASFDQGRVQNAGLEELQLNENRVSLSIRDTWSLEKWIFYLGLRSEQWSEDKLQWAPRAGIRWNVHEEEGFSQSWRMGLGRAYRIPSLSERYVDLGSVRGNPDLEPEIGWSADLSWDMKVGRFAFSLTPFATYYQSTILFMPQSLYLVQAENARDALALGMESRLSLALPMRHRLTLGHTFTHARFLDPDVAMPGRPKHSGHLSLVGHMGPLEHEILVRGRSGVSLDRFGGIREEGHIWLDANLAWQRRSFSLVLRLQNILDDRSAVDHLQQALPGRSIFLVFDLGAPS